MTTPEIFARECADECAYYRSQAARWRLSPFRGTYVQLAWDKRRLSREWASLVA